jgi:hypothetical protein
VYLGCFASVGYDEDFEAFVSHLPNDIITPYECVRTCNSLAFSMAILKYSSENNVVLCFCKSSANTAVLASDSNCQAVNCLAESVFCGGQNFIRLYRSDKLGITVNYKKPKKNVQIINSLF